MQPHLLEKDRAVELTLAHKLPWPRDLDGWMDVIRSDRIATF